MVYNMLILADNDSRGEGGKAEPELSVSPLSNPLSPTENDSQSNNIMIHSEPSLKHPNIHMLPTSAPVKSRSISSPFVFTSNSSPEASTRVPYTRSQSLVYGSEDNEVSNLNKFTRNYIIPAAKWAYSPMTKKKKSFDSSPYKIEYSVFKPVANYTPVQSEKDILIIWKHVCESNQYARIDMPENYVTVTEFNLIVENMVDLMESEGIYPKRVAQGSSGSYFIEGKKRHSNVITKVGIFKPKDEEPYGALSPKWTKWIHRTFFPCFFGRSCLIQNLGYISEVAASVLDRQLLSYIVPYTEIIYLKSPTFYYSLLDRFEGDLPSKIGSFQLFLNGYANANEWLRFHPLPLNLLELPDNLHVTVGLHVSNPIDKFMWSKESLQQFREELEKLVILDYIMRNTDRGLDNWMIKVDWNTVLETKETKTLQPWIKIGAIDSGLAFPWKRPDEWRSFPFGWLFLPLAMIGQPFSQSTRKHYLPLLTSKYWWEQTVTNLRQVFAKDKDFKESKWLQQLAVLKGQAFNVVEILKLSYAGPLELVRREDLSVWDDVMDNPNLDLNMDEETITSRHYDENTPLMNNTLNTGPIINQDRQVDISGYDRISQPDFTNCCTKHNRKVIIERLEKADSKPPVFTCC